MAKERKRRVVGAGGYYTTGEAADICGLSLQTMIRSFDLGQLQGYRCPGAGGFRRIFCQPFLQFLRDRGIPFKEPPVGPDEAKQYEGLTLVRENRAVRVTVLASYEKSGGPAPKDTIGGQPGGPPLEPDEPGYWMIEQAWDDKGKIIELTDDEHEMLSEQLSE